MKVNFKELEDYLNEFGYPYNEMMESESFEIPEETSYEYLMNNMKDYSDAIAMTFFGRKIKYSEFAEEIEKTANAMKGIGLVDGDRVATLVPNIPEATYLQYGTSKIGSVPSNIDPRTAGKMMLSYVRNEKIKNIVVVDVMYESAIRPIEHELKEQYGINRIIVIPATNALPKGLKRIIDIKNRISGVKPITSDVLEIVYWNDMINNTKYEHAANIGFRPNREAVVQHSSGTTKGIPKSIPLTNENINSFVEKMKPVFYGKYPPGTRMLNILPYFASYGAINVSHQSLNLGFTLQQIPEFKFEDFGYIAAQQKSELLVGTPTWYALATKDKRIKKDSLKHLKMAMSGGDSVDEKTMTEINEFLKSHGAQCIMTNGHGMSELGGSGCYQFPGHENGIGVGVPSPYDKYIILDEKGDILPMTREGVKGCVWIYSPSATNGVFEGHRFAETKEINGFRFINSKDTMLIMPNNEITYIEREDRAFARFDGHKIVPFDVESKFTSHPLIKQCIVVPYDDDIINGKMPIAYLVSERDLSPEEQDRLITEIVNVMIESEDTNNRDIPRKISFISEIPTNAMSKNDFRALEQRKIDGSEYTIDIQETNLSSSDARIIPPITRTEHKVLKKDRKV
ncbi:MAG: acyl--CoA ligase [Bacilli bacterium]|nr:acyl--CoA ligase [Bacilli bacterium]